MSAIPDTIRHEQHLRRLVQQVHALGPAMLLHLLREIDRGADLEATLERYARLSAGFVRELGGDRFPPIVIAIAGRCA